MARAYLSLGSNQKRRKDNLKKALKLLKECGITINKQSSIFDNKAISKVSQRNYLNQCIEIETNFPPEKLLQIIKLIEKQMGRIRSKRKRSGYEKSRIIDIDILLYENMVIQKKNLKIPHKKMHERYFVLKLLNEIAPHLVYPLQHKTINQLLKELNK